MALNIALLGAGIFATEAHLPAIKAAGSALHLSAVYSRSQKSSSTLAQSAKEQLGYEVAVYNDESPDANLAALLSRSDIQAVIVALPINTQPDIIIKALDAGMSCKHVLSEKPIHNSLKQGKSLIDTYSKSYADRGLHWRVAENFECEPAILKARDVIRDGTIGDVSFFRLSNAGYIDEEASKYYKTPWRTQPEYQGGFLLDGGVHSAALLRTILPSKITAIVGQASLSRAILAPHDTINAVLQTAPSSSSKKDGAHGIFELSFGLPGPSSAANETNGTFVTGTKGWLSLTSFSKEGTSYWRLTVGTYVKNDKTGELEEKKEVIEERTQGVEREVEYFAQLIGGKDLGFGKLESVLADVALIEGGLTSAGKTISLA